MTTETCPRCGALIAVENGDHRYDECGVSGVILVGAEIRSCRACGWKRVSPENTTELVERISRLATGGDVRIAFVNGHWRSLTPCVLLAVQSPWSRARFSRHLAASQISAVIVSSHGELVAALEQWICPVAVMDRQSRDLIQKLRELSPETRLIVIGRAEVDSPEERSLDAGAAACLEMSVRSDRFVKTVKKLL
jgi:hypothetical protein